MTEETETISEPGNPSERPGKDAPRRCSRWATTSWWAGSIGLALALLAFALTECKWEHSDDMLVIAWLLGIVAWGTTMASSLVGLIRIARSRGKRWGYGRAWMGFGLGLLAGACLLAWCVGMVSHTFHW